MSTSASVSMQITPMPYEVDFTGFVSNTVAPKWMERLRIILMTQCFPGIDLKDPSNLSVISRVEIDYRRPIKFTASIICQAFVKKVLNSSWVIGFHFEDMSSSEIYFEGSQVGVFIDSVTFKPKRMPSIISQKLKLAR